MSFEVIFRSSFAKRFASSHRAKSALVGELDVPSNRLFLFAVREMAQTNSKVIGKAITPMITTHQKGNAGNSLAASHAMPIEDATVMANAHKMMILFFLGIGVFSIIA